MTDDLSLFRALTDDEAGGRLGVLVEGHLAAVVTGALARLDVAGYLTQGPAGTGELAAAVGADADALHRLLAAAAVYGVVTYETDARFALTPTGARLSQEASGSMRDLVMGFCWRFAPLWQATDLLIEAVRTGRPASGNGPAQTMATFRRAPDEAASFARSLRDVTGVLLADLDGADYVPPTGGRIVDVGGGTGALLAGLLRRVPGARGTLLDREQVLAAAAAVLAEAGVADRVDPVAGDFFEEVPLGDMHVLSQVLHDWDDEHARRIVDSCGRASRPGGSLAVIECVLPSAPGPSLAHVMDLMMLMAGSGRERTCHEHEALMSPAGYRLVRDVPLPGAMPWRVLEFRRDGADDHG